MIARGGRPPCRSSGPHPLVAIGVGLAAVGGLAGSGVAQAPSATRLLLERSDATIEIVNAGRADEGARSILSLAGCLDDASLESNLFYAPGGGVSARIEQQDGEPADVAAPLIVVVRPGAAEDEAGGEADGGEADDDETLEALDVTATFGRPPCLASTEPADPARVTLEQGRTTATGARFFLDRQTDVATMDGPVTLRRTPQGEGDPVDADATALEYNLSTGRASLTGDVEVRSGGRESSADRLELDEEAGVATLYGSPAVSREGEDVVRGERLIYDLETNDVVVEGGVEATFELEGE